MCLERGNTDDPIDVYEPMRGSLVLCRRCTARALLEFVGSNRPSRLQFGTHTRRQTESLVVRCCHKNNTLKYDYCCIMAATTYTAAISRYSNTKRETLKLHLSRRD